MRPWPHWSVIAAVGAIDACGRGGAPERTESPVEAQIRHSLAAQLAPIGVEVQAVTCASRARAPHVTAAVTPRSSSSARR